MEALMEMICDKCGSVVPEPEWKMVRDGEIEHTYFYALPVVSLTGSVRRIVGYARILKSIQRWQPA